MKRNDSIAHPLHDVTSLSTVHDVLSTDWYEDCSPDPVGKGVGSTDMHDFEFYDDRFSCPNCQEALPYCEFPQTCEECGFIVEVFMTRDDAVNAMLGFEEDPDSITTRPCHVYGLGWVLAHTRLLLV